MAATSSSRWPRSRCRGNCSRTHSTGHCRTAPTAGCDARREAVDHSVFESKRQETCALMAEKFEVCGTDCCKSATPARNDLAVPRFAHDSHCQCGQGGILLLRRHVIWGMSGKNGFLISSATNCLNSSLKPLFPTEVAASHGRTRHGGHHITSSDNGGRKPQSPPRRDLGVLASLHCCDVQSLSAGTALHARSRPGMASQVRHSPSSHPHLT
jgi:hypothetical protein